MGKKIVMLFVVLALIATPEFVEASKSSEPGLDLGVEAVNQSSGPSYSLEQTIRERDKWLAGLDLLVKSRNHKRARAISQHLKRHLVPAYFTRPTAEDASQVPSVQLVAVPFHPTTDPDAVLFVSVAPYQRGYEDDESYTHLEYYHLGDAGRYLFANDADNYSDVIRGALMLKQGSDVLRCSQGKCVDPIADDEVVQQGVDDYTLVFQALHTAKGASYQKLLAQCVSNLMSLSADDRNQALVSPWFARMFLEAFPSPVSRDDVIMSVSHFWLDLKFSVAERISPKGSNKEKRRVLEDLAAEVGSSAFMGPVSERMD